MHSSTLQPWKWQLTGIGYSTAAQPSGAHCQTLDPQLCSQTYYAPVSHARPSPHNLCTLLHGSLLIYRPVTDGWLSWPCWLTDSGRLNHKVVTHPASSLAQDRESSLVETSVLTTMLRCQLNCNMLHWCLSVHHILSLLWWIQSKLRLLFFLYIMLFIEVLAVYFLNINSVLCYHFFSSVNKGWLLCNNDIWC